MALPKHTDLMLPVLEFHADGEPHRGPELEEMLVAQLDIDESERQEKNKSGARTLVNRIAWAQVDLSQAGLLVRPERGVTQITERGRDVLSSPPDVIDRQYLQRFSEFKNFLNRSRDRPDGGKAENGEGVTREAVLAALDEAAEIGRDEFLKRYGFGRAVSYLVIHDDEEFDSKAIYGAAYGYAHPDRGPLRSSDFSGGQAQVVQKLQKLGFEVRGHDSSGSETGWDQLLDIAARERVKPDFDTQERGYKLEIANAIRRVIELATDGGDWLDELRSAWRRRYSTRNPSDPDETAEYNLTNFRQHEWFIGWARADQRVRSAVANFAGLDEGLADRFGRFAEAAEQAAAEGLAERSPASVLGIGSLFTLAVEPTEAPLVRTRVFEKCERAVGFDAGPAASGRERYGQHLEFAKEARRRMEAAGIDIRDMLDVQSLLFLASHHLGKGETPTGDKAGDQSGARVWWVNQGASFGRSRAGGYIWAPQLTKDGSTRPDWEALTRVRDGDLVLNYANGAVRAVSTAQGEASDASRPDPENDQAWNENGRRIDVRYRDLVAPIELHQIPVEWRREEGGPFDRNGGVKQGYLYELSSNFAAQISERFPELELTDAAPQRRSIDDVAAELYVPASFLRESIELLERKRQLIFYGPPGTGKTYIARKLARYLTDEDPERLEIVQFHPSYSYEDFVEGYRPDVDAQGEMTYVLKSGPLVRLARRAEEVPHRRHVLLVDEINRGNLPRIFGELLFLLEYRNERVSLLYGGDEPFALPDNLWVIGTMNTADRSIGLIDGALRRRFHFQPLFPARSPIDEVLTKWLAKNVPSMAHVAEDVDRLNVRLRDRFGEQIQIGHSYFMQPDLDEDLLEQIWRADILPFLEEQLFGHEDELSDFSLEVMRDTVEVRAPDELPAEEDLRDDDQPDGVRDRPGGPDATAA